MPQLTFDPTDNSVDQAQQEAEAQALIQGEKLAQAAAEDRARAFEQLDKSNEDVSLIGGKFKSQEDLLKAYEELQKKLGKGEETDEEEPTEEEEQTQEEQDEAESALTRAAEEYSKGGQLSEEAIEELSKLDSKELIKAYVDFYTKNANNYQQQAAIQQEEANQIMAIAGGQEAYGEMIQWASQNLDPSEVDAFNSVTNSGNVPAIRFAVEALQSRYKASEGFEAPLVSGKRSSGPVRAYRSQAELARDIADPRYQTDPAFRQDVEEKLANSTDLL